jgi:hypothetical protein
MSKSRIAIAVAVLATLLPFAAFGRGHFGPIGIVRYTVGRLLPFGASHRPLVMRGHIGSADLARGDTPSRSLMRGQVVAAAALAGWHGGRNANGWWRHGDGGYGWVGPLFWPYALDDMSAYTVFGDAAGFWAYGYPDIYAGIFAPYGQEDLAAYLEPSAAPRRHHRLLSLQLFCGETREPAARAAIDRIRQAIRPSESQRAALDELASASLKAGEIIRASCPTQPASGAPERLQAMQARIEAMKQAALVLQPPLGKLYDQLNDTQKGRFNTLAEARRKTSDSRTFDPRSASVSAKCPDMGQSAMAQFAPVHSDMNSSGMAQSGIGQSEMNQSEMNQSAALQWPSGEIEDRLHPTDSQRATLGVLRDASDAAAVTLLGACEENEPVTPPARLAAVARRLDAWLEAVKPVGEALQDLYATLNDEQKAQFEAIGPGRTS